MMTKTETNKMTADEIIQKYEQLGLLDPKWGRYIECGNGWLPLVASCLAELYQYKQQTGAEFKVECIKEKFGDLRFYLSDITDEIYEITGKYEVVASQICEACGASTTDVKKRSGGWLRVLCDGCSKEREV